MPCDESIFAGEGGELTPSVGQRSLTIATLRSCNSCREGLNQMRLIFVPSVGRYRCFTSSITSNFLSDIGPNRGNERKNESPFVFVFVFIPLRYVLRHVLRPGHILNLLSPDLIHKNKYIITTWNEHTKVGFVSGQDADDLTRRVWIWDVRTDRNDQHDTGWLAWFCMPELHQPIGE